MDQKKATSFRTKNAHNKGKLGLTEFLLECRLQCKEEKHCFSLSILYRNIVVACETAHLLTLYTTMIVIKVSYEFFFCVQ
jgi:hypothetical protein